MPQHFPIKVEIYLFNWTCCSRCDFNKIFWPVVMMNKTTNYLDKNKTESQSQSQSQSESEMKRTSIGVNVGATNVCIVTSILHAASIDRQWLFLYCSIWKLRATLPSRQRLLKELSWNVWKKSCCVAAQYVGLHPHQFFTYRFRLPKFIPETWKSNCHRMVVATYVVLDKTFSVNLNLRLIVFSYFSNIH